MITINYTGEYHVGMSTVKKSQTYAEYNYITIKITTEVAMTVKNAIRK